MTHRCRYSGDGLLLGGIEDAVADPETNTSDGVDHGELGCRQIEFAAQVREMNVDDMRVANPVRAPHGFKQIGT